MFCPNCGTSVNDGTAFCPTCGAQLTTAYNQQPQYQQPQYQQPVAPQQKMGWFKFLIYFGLFAGALVNLINGYSLLSGDVYDGNAKLVYAFFSELESIDKLVGIAFIALAAFSIFVRFRLAGFYKNAPTLLNVVYIASVVILLIYIIGVTSAVEGLAEYLDFSTYIGNIVGSGIAIAINTVYFKKRAHLFVK